MRTIIGLVGVKTAGKSTVADMIKEFLPNSKESALANKLKEVCSSVFRIPRSTFDDQRYKEIPFKIFNLERHLGMFETLQILKAYEACDSDIGVLEYQFPESLDNVIGTNLKSARHIAQIVGTEVLRSLGDEDIHCKNVNTLKEGVTVISDVRFPNELEYFSNLKDGTKFLPIYISRDEAEKHVTSESHASERYVLEFRGKCIKLDNNGTLESTKSQLEKILKDNGVI